ncbi:carboxymuconolactone decarboxylase family protein [Candidatus Dependentiae bacterium]|nr:carboxymuconolactone decarboxylase family protein [Candidatus Dependentiae bacterium]
MENNKDLQKQRASEAFVNSFREEYPDFAEHFKKFWSRKRDERVFSYKYMEFIRIAMGLLQDCDSCVKTHLISALENGATKQEIFEVISITVSMSGKSINKNIKFLLKTLEEYEKNQ